MVKQLWRSLDIDDESILKPLANRKCRGHKHKILGYIAWGEWADRKTRQGHIQKLCPICGYYFFKCEY